MAARLQEHCQELGSEGLVNRFLNSGTFGICLDGELLAIGAVASPGQGELRDKVHLSHRCFASAAWNDFHLRRRHGCKSRMKRNYHTGD